MWQRLLSEVVVDFEDVLVGFEEKYFFFVYFLILLAVFLEAWINEFGVGIDKE